ncbi:putative transcriptional regulatory protein [Colletotrichum fructicola]|nr:putative transcriptional regulatory protein [Colletotrichum fructicola]KAF4934736.1 putative transcriptional regulatory protein [Colletotrichum fructicola]
MQDPKGLLLELLWIYVSALIMVKCDHRRPVCSGCEKYGGECVWPERKKSIRRGEKKLYENIVTRLAQMERLVEELQEPKEPKEPKEPSAPKKKATVAKKGPQVLTPEESSSNTNPPQPALTASTISTQVSPASYPPSPASSSPRTAKPYYAGASEGTVGTAGSCSLFSAEGIAKIDTLVGDTRYSDAVRNLLQQVRSFAPKRSLDFSSSPRDYPFPPNDIVIFCVNEYMRTLNNGIRLLQESKVRAAVNAYMYGQPCDEPGWELALNVIIMHELRRRDWNSDNPEHKHYLNNALALIPNAILQTPNPMTIGSLLSLVYYFIFSAENHIAVSILALATQFILLAGYHNPDHPNKVLGHPADVLHRRRLFWQAYVLDHDLMLRIGKPPLISDDFLLELPEEFPADGYGVYYYPGDVTLSYFHQQVRLSQIQGHIYSKLYSQSGEIMSAATLESTIAHLDAELQDWWQAIPELIRPEPQMDLLDADYTKVMSLTVLNFMYFQLVVAIHSAAFRLPLLDEDDDGLRPSVALCVNAARAAIALLKHQQLQHPFTIYLLYQVAWSVDILFVNIIENKTSTTALQDLELIKMVINFFESYDPNYQTVASYHIIKVLYEVASSVVLGCPPGPCSQMPATTTIPCPQILATDATSSLGIPSTSSPRVPPGLEFGGDWGNISLGGHDWFSAGFLQMADWGLPISSQSMPGLYEDTSPLNGNPG